MERIGKEQLASALADIGAAAVEAGKVIDLAVYGGSCLVLVSNFRLASHDVDAVAIEDQAFVDAVAKQIAVRRNWPSDWLNDGVRTYLSPNVEGLEAHELFTTYPSEVEPGLRVFVPTAEYMLAMKLMAMRIEPGNEKDLVDIVNLMRVVGVQKKDDIVAFAAAFYPRAQMSGKLHMALGEIWDAFQRTQSDDATPEFLGRSGPPSRR